MWKKFTATGFQEVEDSGTTVRSGILKMNSFGLHAGAFSRIAQLSLSIEFRDK